MNSSFAEDGGDCFCFLIFQSWKNLKVRVKIKDLISHTLQDCDIMNLKTLEHGFTEDFIELFVLHEA